MFIYILLIVLPLHAYAACPLNAVFTSKDNLKVAIRECAGPDVTEDEYKRMNTWNVSGVQDMSNLFRRGYYFQDWKETPDWRLQLNNDKTGFGFTYISNWVVSGVTNMNSMFVGTTTFNADLSKWDVSGVDMMETIFGSARAFNSDLSKWNVKKITDMTDMFAGAHNFEGTGLSNWDVSRVVKMTRMFDGALAFREDLSNWQLSDYMIHGWRSDTGVSSVNLETCRQERLAAIGYQDCEYYSPNINIIQSMFRGTSVSTLLCGKWLEINDGDFLASMSYLNENVLQGQDMQGDGVIPYDNPFLDYYQEYPIAQIEIGTVATCTCPSGTFGQMPNCHDCALGYYTNQHNSTDCKACAVGKFQNVSGSTSCKYCDDGQWTGLNKGQSICVTVPDSVTVRDSVCGSGTTLVNNTCVASGSNSVCGSGTTLVNNTCVIATNTTEECGALKTIYNEGGCCN
jgi:surface protein